MGVGAALVKRGNDSQLLLAVSVFSPTGLVAIGSMLVGLFLGLSMRRTRDRGPSIEA